MGFRAVERGWPQRGITSWLAWRGRLRGSTKASPASVEKVSFELMGLTEVKLIILGL